MLLKTSIDRKQKEIEIEQRCGQSFNLLTKIKESNYLDLYIINIP